MTIWRYLLFNAAVLGAFALLVAAASQQVNRALAASAGPAPKRNDRP